MKNIDTIIGIDPGITGAIAIKFRNQYKVYKMPADLQDIEELLKFYKGLGSVLVIIEKITLHRTQDMAKVSRMLKMFANFEHCKTLMTTNGIPFVEVAPISWQSYLNLRTERIKAMERPERKKAYRDFAQTQFPHKLSIQVGDAVCLLIYGIRKLKYDTDFELPIVNERMI